MSESVAAEHDYIGLSEFPTMEATTMSDKTKTRDNTNGLNFKATELRLGLPGSESPERVDSRFLALNKSSCPVSGAKRVFSDAINESNKWIFSTGSTTATGDVGSGSGPGSSVVKDGKSTTFPKPAVPVKEKKSSATAPASK